MFLPGICLIVSSSSLLEGESWASLVVLAERLGLISAWRAPTTSQKPAKRCSDGILQETLEYHLDPGSEGRGPVPEEPLSSVTDEPSGAIVVEIDH